MRRIAQFAFAVLLLGAPGMVSAQKGKPGSNLWIRSAQLYRDQALQNKIPAEQQALFKKMYDQAILSTQKDAGNAQGYLLAGEGALGIGQLAEGDQLLTKAEQLYPDYGKEIDQARLMAWVALYNAGVTAIQANKLDDAVASLEKADIVYRKRPSARLTLASIYQNKGQLDKAIAEYKGALEILQGPDRKGLSPQDEKAWATYEDKAITNLAQLVAFAAENAPEAERPTKYNEAAQVYQQVLQRDPHNVRASMNLAYIYGRSGKRDDATKIYTDVLGRPDLSDADYFNIGVGLFQADKYAQAADAFRKAVAANPNSRDAQYNLAQAIFAQTKDLEDAKEKVLSDAKAQTAPAAKNAAVEKAKQINQQLVPYYTELEQVSGKVLALDPNSRTALRLEAQANRGLGDAASDAASQGRYKAQTMALLKQDQDLPFDIANAKLLDGEAGGVVVSGALENLKLPPGTPVKLHFTLYGKDGSAADTQDVTVTTKGTGDIVPFEVKSAKDAVGWKYEVVK
jgi:tetratricopeptide (TPR) repeat protein